MKIEIKGLTYEVAKSLVGSDKYKGWRIEKASVGDIDFIKGMILCFWVRENGNFGYTEQSNNTNEFRTLFESTPKDVEEESEILTTQEGENFREERDSLKREVETLTKELKEVKSNLQEEQFENIAGESKLKGKVEVYERLIAGGFTNLSK